MLQKYQTFPFEKIFWEEYESLVIRTCHGINLPFPRVNDLIFESKICIDVFLKEKQVHQDVEAGLHEQLGYELKDYKNKALEGRIAEFRYPQISDDEIGRAVIEYLLARRIPFVGVNKKVINCPWGDVW